MKYMILVIVVFSILIIGITLSIEIVNAGTDLHSLNSVYKDNTSILSLFDKNSSFYYSYPASEISTYFILRKFGHFLLYGLIASIIFFILPIKHLWLKGLCALCSTSLIGLVDEIHQYFLINRSGRIIDVLIDTIGSLTFVTLLVFFCALIKLVKIIIAHCRTKSNINKSQGSLKN